MKVTRQFIEKHKTIQNGWTKKQLRALGVSWPPSKHWIRQVIGREITAANAAVFMADGRLAEYIALRKAIKSMERMNAEYARAFDKDSR